MFWWRENQVILPAIKISVSNSLDDQYFYFLGRIFVFTTIPGQNKNTLKLFHRCLCANAPNQFSIITFFVVFSQSVYFGCHFPYFVVVQEQEQVQVSVRVEQVLRALRVLGVFLVEQLVESTPFAQQENQMRLVWQLQFGPKTKAKSKCFRILQSWHVVTWWHQWRKTFSLLLDFWCNHIRHLTWHANVTLTRGYKGF